MVFCDSGCSLVFGIFEAQNCMALCFAHKTDTRMLCVKLFRRSNDCRRWGARASPTCSWHVTGLSLGKKHISSNHNVSISGNKPGPLSGGLAWNYCTTDFLFVPPGNFSRVSIGIP